MYVVYSDNLDGTFTVNEIHQFLSGIVEGKSYVEVDEIVNPKELGVNEIVMGMFIIPETKEIYYTYGQKTIQSMSDSERANYFLKMYTTTQLKIDELTIMLGDLLLGGM